VLEARTPVHGSFLLEKPWAYGEICSLIPMKFLLLFFLALSPAAYGQLGGTKDELTARWGKPTFDKDNDMMFYKKPFHVSADFWNGKCHRLQINKYGADPKKLEALTPKEVEDFLVENPKGAKWADKPEWLYRYTKDKKFRAVVIASVITVESVAYSKEREKMKKK